MFRRIYNVLSGNYSRWNQLRNDQPRKIEKRVNQFLFFLRTHYRGKPKLYQFPSINLTSNNPEVIKSVFFPFILGAISIVDHFFSPDVKTKVIGYNLKMVSDEQMACIYNLCIEHLLIIHFKKFEYVHELGETYLAGTGAETKNDFRHLDSYLQMFENRDLVLQDHAVHLFDSICNILEYQDDQIGGWTLLAPVITGSYEIVIECLKKGNTTQLYEENAIKNT